MRVWGVVYAYVVQTYESASRSGSPLQGDGGFLSLSIYLYIYISIHLYIYISISIYLYLYLYL